MQSWNDHIIIKITKPYTCDIYSMLTGPIYKIEFCVQGCDIARACEGYITSKDTKPGSYILYTGPVSILYTIYIIIVTSPA